MIKYYKHFKYLIKHKLKIFPLLWNKKLYRRAFTHDITAFRPGEFIPVAKYLYGDYPSKIRPSAINYSWMESKEDIEKEYIAACRLHHSRNKHHFPYKDNMDSKPITMDLYDIEEMVCDLYVLHDMNEKLLLEWYFKRYKSMNIDIWSRIRLESIMEINPSDLHNYGHSMEQFANMYDKSVYDVYFGWIESNYGIDTYNILRDKK